MATPKAPLFGEQLIRQGLITKDQLRIALTEQRKSGKQLGRILVELGFLSEAVMRDALGQAFGRESIDLTSLVPDPDTLKKIPRDLARRFNVVPISFNEESVGKKWGVTAEQHKTWQMEYQHYILLADFCVFSMKVGSSKDKAFFKKLGKKTSIVLGVRE